MDTRESVTRGLFMHVWFFFYLSQSSFPLFTFSHYPYMRNYFLVLNKFPIVQRPSSFDVFFHSNTIYLFRPSLRSKQHLPFILWNYNSPCQVKKQCYQTSTFLSLWLLWVRLQVRFPFASVALLVELKDCLPPFLDAALKTGTSHQHWLLKSEGVPFSVFQLLISWNITQIPFSF